MAVIRPSGGKGIVIQRHLTQASWHTHGKSSLGFADSKQHIPDGTAAFRARIPHQQQCVCQFFHLIQHQRPAGKQHHNHLSGPFSHLAQQLHLIPRQGKPRPAAALAALNRILSQRQHHQVRCPGKLHGLLPLPVSLLPAPEFSFPLGGKGRQIGIIFGQNGLTALAPVKIQSFRLRKCFPYGHHGFPVPVQCPQAQGIFPVCKGADQGDSACACLTRFPSCWRQRQQALFIFQQH